MPLNQYTVIVSVALNDLANRLFFAFVYQATPLNGQSAVAAFHATSCLCCHHDSDLVTLSRWAPSSALKLAPVWLVFQDPDERKPLLQHPNPDSKPPNGTDWTANVPSARNDEQALLTSILTKTAQ